MIDYFNLGSLSIQLEFEAYQRYMFAQAFCNGKNVIDAGSKFGIGTYIISRVASKVIGIDFNKERIEKGISNLIFQPCVNVGFTHFDLEEDLSEKFPSPVDVIVCFETIEHLKCPDKFISQVPDLLKEDGYFIFSVPIGNRNIKEHLHIFNNSENVSGLLKYDFIEHINFTQEPYSYIVVAKKI